MAEEWTEHLRQFALSIDLVDDEIFENIKDLIEEYLLDTVGVSAFRVLVDGFWIESEHGAVQALDTMWAGGGRATTATALVDAEGRAVSHVAHAYLHDVPLWVTAHGEPLRRASVFDDRWGHRDLGHAGRPNVANSGSRTSILLPLRYGNRLFGVVQLEFEAEVLPTEKAKGAASALAVALSRIIWLNSTQQTRVEDTRTAFQRLQRLHDNATSPLERHGVFVSSGADADPSVVEAIRRALERHRDSFAIRFWKDQSASGSINDQVRDALSRCEFGICYLSEPAPDRPGHYADNPNVLFEAGMLQMLHELRDSDEHDVSRWIPVREDPSRSDPLPFNFATERIIHVPRSEDATVDTTALEDRLTAAIDSVVAELRLE